MVREQRLAAERDLTQPPHHRWLWNGVYAVVIVALGFAVYTTSKRVDYTWRWERIPQYIVSNEGERVATPADGIVRLDPSGRALEIHTQSDPPQVTRIDNVDRVTAGEGDPVFAGDIVAIRQGYAAGPLLIGLWITLKISALSLVFALALGLVAGLGRVSANPAPLSGHDCRGIGSPRRCPSTTVRGDSSQYAASFRAGSNAGCL